MPEWGRSDDGYCDSKCGRFEIRPIYSGRVQPIWYALWKLDVRIGWYDTQREAKQAAEDHEYEFGG